MTNLDIIKMNTVDTSHMIDRNNGLHIGTTGEIATSTITKTDEDGRLGTFNGEIGDIHILEYAAIDNLKRNGRRAYPLSEELFALITTGLYHNARDINVTEAAIRLSPQLHRITMARHQTVGDTYIFAQSW